MSDELTDDLAAWPSDPFKLLGVAPGIDSKELKRAYIQLIKRFKPEQYPEHFRRIREAYEDVTNRLAWYGNVAFTPPNVQENDKPAPMPLSSRVSDRAWQLACDGKHEDGYRNLRNEFAANHSSAAAVRLYWLLRLYPDLESDRNPIEWLTDALRRNFGEITLQDLLRRELNLNPRASRNPGADRLLESDLSAEQTADLLRWRWQAAAVTGDRKLVNDDIGRVRDRLRSSPRLWLQALFAAADILAWGKAYGEDSYKRCRDEIRSLDHLTNDFSHEYDRLDHLEFLADQWWTVYWKTYENPPNPRLGPIMRTRRVLDLIPRIWMLPSNMLTPELLGLACELAESPNAWLDHLDRIAVEASAVVNCLANAIRELPDRDQADDEAVLRELVTNKLKSRKFWSRYRFNRGEYLSFCLWQFADPIRTALLLTEQGIVTAKGNSPIALVKADYSLQAVYYAVDRVQS
jgi:hypothetical protein